MTEPDAQRAGTPGDLTRVLEQVSAGVEGADRRLLEAVYAELRRLAASRMRSQDPSHTLQPTALVHEAWMRLLGGADAAPAFRDRGHFFAAAGRAMRSILVDHARRHRARRRDDGGARVTLHPELVGEADPLERVLLVHELLSELAAEHPRTASVVELLFFSGLSVGEAAEALSVSGRTVKRDWRFGRAWLLRAIEER